MSLVTSLALDLPKFMTREPPPCIWLMKKNSSSDDQDDRQQRDEQSRRSRLSLRHLDVVAVRDRPASTLACSWSWSCTPWRVDVLRALTFDAVLAASTSIALVAVDERGLSWPCRSVMAAIDLARCRPSL